MQQFCVFYLFLSIRKSRFRNAIGNLPVSLKIEVRKYTSKETKLNMENTVNIVRKTKNGAMYSSKNGSNNNI